MKNQTFVISGLVGLDWQSNHDLLNIAVFTAELQQFWLPSHPTGLMRYSPALSSLSPITKLNGIVALTFGPPYPGLVQPRKRGSVRERYLMRILLDGSQLSFLNTTYLAVYNSTGRTLFLCSNDDLVRITVAS